MLWSKRKLHHSNTIQFIESNHSNWTNPIASIKRISSIESINSKRWDDFVDSYRFFNHSTNIFQLAFVRSIRSTTSDGKEVSSNRSNCIKSIYRIQSIESNQSIAKGEIILLCSIDFLTIWLTYSNFLLFDQFHLLHRMERKLHQTDPIASNQSIESNQSNQSNRINRYQKVR